MERGKFLTSYFYNEVYISVNRKRWEFKVFTLNDCKQTHEPLSTPKLRSPLIIDLMAVRA